jgi:hypothetical protein
MMMMMQYMCILVVCLLTDKQLVHALQSQLQPLGSPVAKQLQNKITIWTQNTECCHNWQTQWQHTRLAKSTPWQLFPQLIMRAGSIKNLDRFNVVVINGIAQVTSNSYTCTCSMTKPCSISHCTYPL